LKLLRLQAYASFCHLKKTIFVSGKDLLATFMTQGVTTKHEDG